MPNLLTILILVPAAGGLATLIMRNRDAVRWMALTTTLITFVVSLLLLFFYDWHKTGPYGYDSTGGTVQMVQQVPWIAALNMQYKVGIDGLSLPLVILTTGITVLACIASWNIEKITKGYFALFLFLESSILGVFLSLDFFLFYVFFEVSLVPMYFLIGVWGGPRKELAAIKFFLYALLGSIGLLIVVIGTYHYSRSIKGIDGINGGTFDLVLLARPDVQRAMLAAGMSSAISKTFFLLALLAFFIKLASVPFHSWLPDALVEAPTPISMILAALLLNLGGYGLFRVAYPLFPQAAKAMWLLIAIIGVVSIIYGTFCAMGQTDFKRLVAYSSVSHMGFVTLGAAMMTTAGVNGAIFMMISHGITSSLMFFIVGVVYDRAHHREMSRLGGLATTMPIYTGFSTVACFANLGLPGLCGFVGEVMVLIGSFAAAREDSVLMNAGASAWTIDLLSVIACFGTVLTAAYMLWAVQRVFLGPEKSEYQNFKEIDSREMLVLTPLTVMAIVLGVLPAVVFVFTNTTVTAMVAGR
jgi:NADH-quinone oxidoreductase subunit M